MIDIHSHVLWGLDDGAETLADSIGMLKMAAEAGTTEIVATPHANHQYHYDEALIDQRIRELSAATDGRPKIHRGCDFQLTFENIEDSIAHPGRYSIAGGAYILVEFPNAPVHGYTAALTSLLDRGLIPIMTHPERHPDLQKINQNLLRWIEMGCLVQITGQSLLGRFGKGSEASAWAMLNRGLAHFVASDAHGTQDRTPRLDEAFAAVARRFGPEIANNLFVENPRAAVCGDLIYSEVRKRPWYRFFR